SAGLPGYSGTGFMEATPNSGSNFSGHPALLTTAPRLDYKVKFRTGGIRYVWVHGFANDGSDDSLHAGINGENPEGARRIDRSFTANTWIWVGQIEGSNPETGDNKATITVPSAGEQTVNIWMREDGLRFDKLILTTDPAFAPSGIGQPESEVEGGKPTTPTLSAARTATGLRLTFTGALQQADTVTGPWTDATATSPHDVTVSTGQKFYRTR
ncbi:MAG TPA: hypothetical protein VMS21_03810, partial [Methylomirabilota bacterium]|nr:hypothetical protein [Methylomirabilota bacterium]